MSIRIVMSITSLKKKNNFTCLKECKTLTLLAYLKFLSLRSVTFTSNKSIVTLLEFMLTNNSRNRIKLFQSRFANNKEDPYIINNAQEKLDDYTQENILFNLVFMARDIKTITSKLKHSCCKPII